MVNIFNAWNIPVIKSLEKEKWMTREKIILARTDLVTQHESDAVKYWIERFLKEIWSILSLVDVWNHKVSNGDFWSTDWYQEKSLTQINKGLWKQVNWDKIIQLLLSEPYQRQSPHYDFAIFDADMRVSDASNNYVFWLWWYPNNILSVKRFRNYISNPWLMYMSLSIAAAHELWHNFDLTNRNFNSWQEWYHLWHCMWKSWSCLMEQTNVWGKDIEQVAKDLFDRENWLCSDCKDEISFRLSEIRRLWVLI